MNDKKKMKSWMIGSIIFLVGALIFGKVANGYTKNIVKETYDLIFEEYDYVDINDENFEGLKILDKDLEDNIVFLTGEWHETVKATEMNFYMLKYFVEKAGVKYILLERAYSDGLRLNEYLKTGDEKILDRLKELYRDNYAPAETEEIYKLYKDIYEFNKELKEEDKLKFIGIDTEHHHGSTMDYLKKFIPKTKDYPKEIEAFLEILKSCNSVTRHIDYNAEAKKMREEIARNEEVFKNYYKEEYFDLVMTLENLATSFGTLYRDEKIYNNFKKVYENNREGKYFGQFGALHVDKNSLIINEKEYETIAGYLDKFYDETKDKVLTINYEFKDSKTSYSDSKYEEAKNGEDIIEYTLLKEIFPLDKRTLIFKSKEDMLPVDKDSYKNYTGFDYGMLFSNSEKHTKVK